MRWGQRRIGPLDGLPVERVIPGVYAVSGFCSALGGVVATVYTGSGNPTTGTGLELDAIAAAVIGGTLLTGGRRLPGGNPARNLDFRYDPIGARFRRPFELVVVADCRRNVASRFHPPPALPYPGSPARRRPLTPRDPHESQTHSLPDARLLPDGVRRFRRRSPAFRPPATPLVAHDPNFSIWSEADHLTDDRDAALDARGAFAGLPHPGGWQGVSIDGIEPKEVPALPQTGLQVTPTRSIYEFENESCM